MSVGQMRFRGPAHVAVVAQEPLLHMLDLALNHGVFQTTLYDRVDSARSEIQDRSRSESQSPHLIVVDLDLEPGQPMRLIGMRRLGGGTIPSIAMTRRGEIKSKLAAFDAGADDIITVPVSPEELVARVLALMRRTYGEVVQFIPTIKIRELEIDLLNQRVRAGSARLHLTASEQALLYLLASNPGRIVTREEILDSLWGSDYDAESNVVDRHVRNLRVKLKNSWRRPRYIATVPGRGYRFLMSADSGEQRGPDEGTE